MVRQCAWCLCLIDCAGERLSPSPLPKLYEASHGICSVCGTAWIARATENHTGQGPVSQPEYKEQYVSQTGTSPNVGVGTLPDFQNCSELQEVQPSIPQLILDLQQKSRQSQASSTVKKSRRLRNYSGPLCDV